MAQILIVDDLTEMTELMAVFLKDGGHEVTAAHSSAEAGRLLHEKNFSVLITDVLMPGKSGLELIRMIHNERPGGIIPKIIAISGGVRGLGTGTVLKAAETKADIVLKKPFTQKELLSAVEALLEEMPGTASGQH